MFNDSDNEIIITLKPKNRVKNQKPMTVEEYNKRLELSEQAVKKGKVYTQEQVLNQIDTWKQKTLA